MGLALHNSWTSVLALAPHTARGRLKALIPDDPDLSFIDFALQSAQTDASALSTLLGSGVLAHVMTSPDLSDLSQAISLAKACAKLESNTDVKILESVTHPTAPDAARQTQVMRALEIIDAISDCRRLVMPLLKFARIPDAKIRSKAVKLMARASQNGAWLHSILSDADPRVRANMLEGLSCQLGKSAEPLLRLAARDSHHRVSTTALLCLARTGDEASRKKLEELTGDERELHARAASWALQKLSAAAIPSSTTPHPSA